MVETELFLAAAGLLHLTFYEISHMEEKIAHGADFDVRLLVVSNNSWHPRSLKMWIRIALLMISIYDQLLIHKCIPYSWGTAYTYSSKRWQQAGKGRKEIIRHSRVHSLFICLSTPYVCFYFASAQQSAWKKNLEKTKVPLPILCFALTSPENSEGNPV